METIQVHEMTTPESNSIFQSIKSIVNVLDRSEKKAELANKDAGFQLVEENDNEGSDEFEDLFEEAEESSPEKDKKPLEEDEQI